MKEILNIVKDFLVREFRDWYVFYKFPPPDDLEVNYQRQDDASGCIRKPIIVFSFQDTSFDGGKNLKNDQIFQMQITIMIFDICDLIEGTFETAEKIKYLFNNNALKGRYSSGVNIQNTRYLETTDIYDDDKEIFSLAIQVNMLYNYYGGK